MDRSIIEQYEAGGAKLRAAIAGMDDAELRAAPIPGKWSTHQVVIHLADAESAIADRLRRVLAMDDPALLAWDETKFFARLNYDVQSVEDAVQLIELTRRQLARVLKTLPDAEFDRAGTHNERGRQTAKDLLIFAGSHLDHHLGFVREKRAKLAIGN